MPYYNLRTSLLDDFNNGFFNFNSSFSNELVNTNNLRTKLNNDLNFESLSFFSNNGLKNNINLYLKNFNVVAKKDKTYNSNVRSEIMSLIEMNTSYPLINENYKNHKDYLTPRASLKFNPGSMSNYRNEERTINVDNIYSYNRLGLTDVLETGKSITIGLDYKKESLSQINKYFEAKLATVYRDQEEGNIPINSSLNKKNSNLFGSVSINNLNNINLGYNFSASNDLKKFEYNSIKFDLNLKNFISETSFVEENGIMGNTNVIENKTLYEINEKNRLSFNIRRNREIDLTEYYNLSYEYRDDCLIAGIKYNKSFYQDRDLKPSENFLFTITLFPITNFERNLLD